MALQTDGKIVIASGDTVLARLNTDGSVDTAFNASINTGSQVNGARTLAVQADGKILVGGGFTQINGVAHANIARLSTSGSLDTSFNPSTNGVRYFGDVYTIAVQSDGRILVGGGFTQINGIAHAGVARLNADGSLDSTFNASISTGPQSFGVRTLIVQSSGKILVGGGFTQVNGVAHAYLARLNADGSLDASFTPSTNGDVYTIAVQSDGRILVGGGFTQANGVAHANVARLNADGSLDTSFTPSTNAGTNAGVACGVTALTVQSDGKIILGGFFDQVNGVAHGGVARLNADGSVDTSYNTSTNFVGSLVLQTNGKILAGGLFSYVNGAAHAGITRLNTDGSLDSTFAADVALGPNGALYTATVQADGRILVGGYFTQVSGVAHAGLARLNADGSLDSTFNAGSSGTIYTLAVQADGKILVGGNIGVMGQPGAFIARLNADGSLDSTFNVISNGTVFAIAVQADGRIILGGSFSQINGIAHAGLVRLNADGSLDGFFNTSVNTGTNGNAVHTLAMQSDGRIVVGGLFTQVNGVAHSGVARINTDGSLDTTFSTTSAGTIYTLAVQADSRILMGGYFTQVNGVAHVNIARLNTNGSLDGSFNPSTGNYFVFSLAVQADSRILMGGYFTQVNGVAHVNIARLNTNGSLDGSFNPSINTDPNGVGVRTLPVQSNGEILVGGGFTQVNGAVRNYVARLNPADGSLDSGFFPGVGVPKTAALAVQLSITAPTDPSALKVIVGGSFYYLGGQPANGLARLQSDGSADRTFIAPFSPGDSVPAFTRQPKDGNIVASQVPAATSSSSPNSLMLRAVVWPKTQAIIKSDLAPDLRTRRSAGLMDV